METSQQTIIAGVDLDRVRAAVAPVLSANGVELWDIEFLTDRAGWVLRIVIERAGARAADASSSSDVVSGVSLEDCSHVSRDVSAVLDVEDDLIPHHYHLEVSSPGLDRPLRRELDFVRFVGKSARVKLRRPAPDGQRVLRGRLDSAGQGAVAVVVDGKRIEVPFADVEEANLVFELTPQPKKAVAKSKSGRAKQVASKR